MPNEWDEIASIAEDLQQIWYAAEDYWNEDEYLKRIAKLRGYTLVKKESNNERS